MPAYSKVLCRWPLFVAAAVAISMLEPVLRAEDPKVPEVRTDNAAATAQILDSIEWIKTMNGFDDWLSVQVIYNKDQVKNLRRQMQAKVNKMTPNELKVFMDELQQKLRILSSPEAYEARAWADDYLKKASDSALVEFRKKLPDVAAMTVSQLKQALEDNQEQRASQVSYEKAFEKQRDQQVATLRQMQQQAAEASARAASYSGGQIHPGNWGGSMAPRAAIRYPGIGAGYGWGGWRW